MGTIDAISKRFGSAIVAGRHGNSADQVPFSAWMRLLLAMIVTRLERRRSRVHLSRLSADELRDIGVTVDQADYEIRKSLPGFVRHR